MADIYGLGERATDGNAIYPNDAAVTYGYTAGNLTSATITQYGSTYVKTYTYDGSGNLTAESLWVKQ